MYNSSIVIFCEAIKKLSFVKAGDSLGISAAAVSKQIKSLEEKLGVILFYRTTRVITPTEHAIKLFNSLDKNKDEFDTILSEIKSSYNEPMGNLKISIPTSFGEFFLKGPISEFAKTYPNINLEIIFDDKMVNMVEEGYDLIIRIGILEDSGLIAKKMGECPLYMCASKDFLDEYGPIKRIEDISKLPSIVYSNQQKPYSVEFIDKKTNKRTRISLNPKLLSNNASMMLESCIKGLGLSILPIFCCNEKLKSSELIRIFPNYSLVPEREIYAIRYGEYKAHFIIKGAYNYPKGSNKKIVLEEPLLFNLNIDPSEKHNIADKFPEKVEEIKKIAIDHLNSFEPPESVLDYRNSKEF